MCIIGSIPANLPKILAFKLIPNSNVVLHVAQHSSNLIEDVGHELVQFLHVVEVGILWDWNKLDESRANCVCNVACAAKSLLRKNTVDCKSLQLQGTGADGEDRCEGIEQLLKSSMVSIFSDI